MNDPPVVRPAVASGPVTPAVRATARPGLDIYRVWIAALVIMAVVAGIIAIATLHRGPSGTVSTPSWRATAADAATPAWFGALPFNCLGGTNLGVGPTPPLAYVNGVRTGTHPGYDRVTIQFQSGRPAETSLGTQTAARFAEGSSGSIVTLKGQAGALVTLHFTDGHTHYSGPADINSAYPVVLELRKVQDSGGTVQWAIGLSHLPCYRMAFWDGPTRLVIDFAVGPTAS